MGMVCVSDLKAVCPHPLSLHFPESLSVPRFKLPQSGKERNSHQWMENEEKGGSWNRESTLYIASKMSFQDRIFVYFKAHLQALLALQPGNVSKILGLSFV